MPDSQDFEQLFSEVKGKELEDRISQICFVMLMLMLVKSIQSLCRECDYVWRDNWWEGGY